jgi:hypothetical protein
MEPDFATLSEKERVARCLELAQVELDRANTCRDAKTKDLHLSLAECWRSMAKQFGSLSSLQAELHGNTNNVREARSSTGPAIAKFDVPMPLKGFAT